VKSDGAGKNLPTTLDFDKIFVRRSIDTKFYRVSLGTSLGMSVKFQFDISRIAGDRGGKALCPPLAMGPRRVWHVEVRRATLASAPARPRPTSESIDSELPSSLDTMAYLVRGWDSVYGRATRRASPTDVVFTVGAGLSPFFPLGDARVGPGEAETDVGIDR
jgi:hypothetical protein